MQKWEIKRLYIPTTLSVSKDSSWSRNDSYMISRWGDSSNVKWAEAETLASEGWEPVGIVQVITGHEFTDVEKGGGSSYTEGLIVIFKRPIP